MAGTRPARSATRWIPPTGDRRHHPGGMGPGHRTGANDPPGGVTIVAIASCSALGPKLRGTANISLGAWGVFFAPGALPDIIQRFTRAVAERARELVAAAPNGLLVIMAGVLMFSIPLSVASLATFLGALFIVEGVGRRSPQASTSASGVSMSSPGCSRPRPGLRSSSGPPPETSRSESAVARGSSLNYRDLRLAPRRTSLPSCVSQERHFSYGCRIDGGVPAEHRVAQQQQCDLSDARTCLDLRGGTRST